MAPCKDRSAFLPCLPVVLFVDPDALPSRLIVPSVGLRLFLCDAIIDSKRIAVRSESVARQHLRLYRRLIRNTGPSRGRWVDYLIALKFLHELSPDFR
jgi:hypothetical protein